MGIYFRSPTVTGTSELHSPVPVLKQPNGLDHALDGLKKHYLVVKSQCNWYSGVGLLTVLSSNSLGATRNR